MISLGLGVLVVLTDRRPRVAGTRGAVVSAPAAPALAL